jgi:hypothetical protein
MDRSWGAGELGAGSYKKNFFIFLKKSIDKIEILW